ncbi:MAG: amidohydrolase [Candidatus Zophobacter franzmannii]|nr:amidohydrolase [Candidatus Zophobacter franzmannii]
MINNLIQLRHLLHQNAELSNYEELTSGIVKQYIIDLNPTEIINFDYGFAFVWDSYKKGETIMFRADMDALPIQGECDVSYCSKNPNVNHSCGHDGHMTILYGLAKKISNDLPQTGKVVLLFQPAEETGEGAHNITEDPKFNSIKPDKIFGLHNIPGFAENKILLKKDSFACASRGMIIKLYGKTSHAAEPENGISPVFAIEKLINRFHKLIREKALFKEFTSLTIIHIRLGEIAFGTSPGYAEVMVTLRSATNTDMQSLIEKSERIVQQVCKEEVLSNEISYKDIFPAVVNNHGCVDIVSKATEKLGLTTETLKEPFKWSEDFSYYTNSYAGAFFGLGAGIKHPSLHNPEYDFPDEIIDTGVEIFYQIYKDCRLLANQFKL